MAGAPPLPLAAAVIREKSGRRPAPAAQVARDEKLADRGDAYDVVTRKGIYRKPSKATPLASGAGRVTQA
jgi:hypothetical protein